MKYPAFLLLAALISCQTSSSKTEAASKAKTETREDSLYKEVIGYHDEAMPKMGKLMGYQKTLQARIDSIANLSPAKLDGTAKELKARYQQLLSDLQAAEKEMNNWMDSFEPDPKLPGKEELEKYWTDQQARAKKMRDDIIRSIDSAKATLDE